MDAAAQKWWAGRQRVSVETFIRNLRQWMAEIDARAEMAKHVMWPAWTVALLFDTDEGELSLIPPADQVVVLLREQEILLRMAKLPFGGALA